MFLSYCFLGKLALNECVTCITEAYNAEIWSELLWWSIISSTRLKEHIPTWCAPIISNDITGHPWMLGPRIVLQRPFVLEMKWVVFFELKFRLQILALCERLHFLEKPVILGFVILFLTPVGIPTIQKKTHQKVLQKGLFQKGLCVSSGLLGTGACALVFWRNRKDFCFRGLFLWVFFCMVRVLGF